MKPKLVRLPLFPWRTSKAGLALDRTSDWTGILNLRLFQPKSTELRGFEFPDIFGFIPVTFLLFKESYERYFTLQSERVEFLSGFSRF